MHVIKVKLSNGCVLIVQIMTACVFPFPSQCEEFHTNTKKKLLERIKLNKLQPKRKFDPKESTKYCEEMRKLLQKELENEEKQHLKGRYDSVANDVVKLLRGMNAILHYCD